MAYNINKYNTSTAPVIVVDDGTINTTLDLKLIGKNYAGYGEVQNENFVWLLENFASRTAPPNAIVGQLWYDSNVQKLKINYAKDKWHTLGITDVIQTNESPEGLSIGDFWWKVDTSQLYCRGSNSEDVLIGGKSPSVVTQMRSSTVTDTLDVVHQIIEGVVDGVTIFIISKDAEFTLKPTVNDINGFVGNPIRPGITMRETKPDLTTDSGYRYWGKSSDSERLNGFLAGEYINKTLPSFPNVANFSDNGITIGLSPNQILHVFNDISKTPVIRNQHDDTIKFQTTVVTGGVEIVKTPMQLVGEDILPGPDLNSNIGTDTARFDTVYATTFNGNATSATLAASATAIEALQADATTAPAVAKIGTPESSLAGALSGSVAVRTNHSFQYNTDTIKVGSLIAEYFVGQSVYVTQADLAEKYLADQPYEVGTVLMIGGEKEVTAAQPGFRAIGSVSQSPAYIMNQKLEGGIPVALKGRVPLKVVGKVKKGDRLVASENGTAHSLTTECSSLVFAVSLEDSDNMDVKLVESLIL